MTVHDGKETFGNFYEEFTIGDIFKHWPGRTITESVSIHISEPTRPY